MKAYLCSVGEKTTAICKRQLEMLRFEVILLSEIENWQTKFKKFINMANEDCIRIDADIILLKNFKVNVNKETTMASWCNIDFFTMDIHHGQPIYYSKKALKIAREHILEIPDYRPDTFVWRLPGIIENTKNYNQISGIHGFFQSEKDIQRIREKRQSNNKEFNEELVRNLK
jgi:hypothetical protein